jgi:hypothetical protein
LLKNSLGEGGCLVYARSSLFAFKLGFDALDQQALPSNCPALLKEPSLEAL